jgi:hypothetical protein
MRFLEAKAAFAGRLRRPRVVARAASDGELKTIGDVRARHLIEVRQPFVLVSQIHRSGGTLLSRLLDGHPELYAVPHELGPLLPSRDVPLDPAAAWSLLYDAKLPKRFARGLRQQREQLNADVSRVDFVLPPSLHRRLYNRVLRHDPPGTGRDVLDAYLTGYFNAWLNYRGDLDRAKRWVTGFEPELVVQPQRIEQFLRLYPDGRLVSIVREPASWFASARRWDPRYAELEPALALWQRSVEATMRLADELGDRCLVLEFDALVQRTEETVGALAEWLGIDRCPELLSPTVNGVPFGANSSFKSAGRGVVQPTTGRGASLDDDERRRVHEVAGDIYARVQSLAGVA